MTTWELIKDSGSVPDTSTKNNMKKVKQWLSSIENKDISKRALNNLSISEDMMDYGFDSFKKALEFAFCWSETPEGYQYWKDVSNGLIPAPPILGEEDVAEEDSSGLTWEFLLPGATVRYGPSISDMVEDGLKDGTVTDDSVWVDQVGGDHYKKLKIQPMEISLANNLNAAQHTAIKYIMRYKDKGGKEDLEKAIHTINLLIKFEYGKEI